MVPDVSLVSAVSIDLKYALVRLGFSLFLRSRLLRTRTQFPCCRNAAKQKAHRKGELFAGIGHPDQPTRLHARWRYELQITRRCYLPNAPSPAPGRTRIQFRRVSTQQIQTTPQGCRLYIGGTATTEQVLPYRHSAVLLMILPTPLPT